MWHIMVARIGFPFSCKGSSILISGQFFPNLGWYFTEWGLKTSYENIFHKWHDSIAFPYGYGILQYHILIDEKWHCEHLRSQRTCCWNWESHPHSQIERHMHCHHDAIQVPPQAPHHQHCVIFSSKAEHLPS